MSLEISGDGVIIGDIFGPVIDASPADDKDADHVKRTSALLPDENDDSRKKSLPVTESKRD